MAVLCLYAWGRLNVVIPFHHLSEDSHTICPLGARPITASSPKSPSLAFGNRVAVFLASAEDHMRNCALAPQIGRSMSSSAQPLMIAFTTERGSPRGNHADFYVSDQWEIPKSKLGSYGYRRRVW